jgi:hypothetical protein
LKFNFFKETDGTFDPIRSLQVREEHTPLIQPYWL